MHHWGHEALNDKQCTNFLVMLETRREHTC